MQLLRAREPIVGRSRCADPVCGRGRAEPTGRVPRRLRRPAHSSTRRSTARASTRASLADLGAGCSASSVDDLVLASRGARRPAGGCTPRQVADARPRAARRRDEKGFLFLYELMRGDLLASSCAPPTPATRSARILLAHAAARETQKPRDLLVDAARADAQPAARAPPAALRGRPQGEALGHVPRAGGAHQAHREDHRGDPRARARRASSAGPQRLRAFEAARRAAHRARCSSREPLHRRRFTPSTTGSASTKLLDARAGRVAREARASGAAADARAPRGSRCAPGGAARAAARSRRSGDLARAGRCSRSPRRAALARSTCRPPSRRTRARSAGCRPLPAHRLPFDLSKPPGGALRARQGDARAPRGGRAPFSTRREREREALPQLGGFSRAAIAAACIGSSATAVATSCCVRARPRRAADQRLQRATLARATARSRRSPLSLEAGGTSQRRGGGEGGSATRSGAPPSASRARGARRRHLRPARLAAALDARRGGPGSSSTPSPRRADRARRSSSSLALFTANRIGQAQRCLVEVRELAALSCAAAPP